MSVAFGALALLLACHLGHVASSNLLILSVTRGDSADPASFIFSIRYQASEQPTVRWRVHKTDGTADYNGKVIHRGEDGIAFLVVAKGGLLYLSTKLGDSNLLHYFHLFWRHDMRPLLLHHEINLPASVITPGHNVTYTKGHTTKVEIQWSEEGAAGVTSAQKGVTLLGTYLDPVSERLKSFKSLSDMEFLQVHVTSTSNTTTNFFTFLTDEFPINGFFEGELRSAVMDESTSPLERIEEHFKLLVHEDTNSGPFPNDGVYTEFLMQDPTCSLSGCAIICHCYSNDVRRYTMQIVKVEPDSTATPVSRHVDVNPRLHLLNTGMFVHGKSGAGRYVCQGLNKETKQVEALTATTVTMV